MTARSTKNVNYQVCRKGSVCCSQGNRKRFKRGGAFIKEEEFMTRIGRSERTNSVVEPKLSLQWFVKMKEISIQAKDAVEKDEIKCIPPNLRIPIATGWRTCEIGVSQGSCVGASHPSVV